jgi:hypothetical protein
MPYRTNAELSVLAESFVDDNERNLLFRIYVPTGRLYAAEADKLLNLFRQWLTQVKKQRIRQDGYSTAAGTVYEFFGDHSAADLQLGAEFGHFSNFLDKCVDNPALARQELIGVGLDNSVSTTLVEKYGREAQRLNLDLRHELENRTLALRHMLENDLLTVSQHGADNSGLLDRLLAKPASAPLAALLGDVVDSAALQAQSTITITQQIINAEGAIIHNLSGTQHYGVEAQDLLALIELFGGTNRDVLQSAVHELEDENARPADRLNARQQIKKFLLGLGGKVGTGALAVLQKYVENKLGL